MTSNNFEFKHNVAERIDRVRVLELLFDDSLDLSDCDSDEDDKNQVSSYFGDEVLDPEKSAALSRTEVQHRMLDLCWRWSFCYS